MNYKSKVIPTKEPVIVTVHEYQGVERLDIRHYFLHASVEQGLTPTRKGISVPVADALALIGAILKVIEIDAESGSATEILPPTTAFMPVKASVKEYKGYKRVDIRHYWQPKDKKNLAPSDKGVAIPIEFAGNLSSILRDLQAQLQAPMSVNKPEIVYQAPSKDSRFAMVEA